MSGMCGLGSLEKLDINHEYIESREQSVNCVDINIIIWDISSMGLLLGAVSGA
jgi:hypothetical protein